MGLTNGVFWMAWFIDSFIIMTFSSAVLTFILSVIYNYVNVYVSLYFYIVSIDTVVFDTCLDFDFCFSMATC